MQTAGPNPGSANLSLQVEALPARIEWPGYPYYTVAGEALQQPCDWLVPVEIEVVVEKHDFTSISPMLLAGAKRLRQESLKRTKTRQSSETRKSRTGEDKKVFKRVKRFLVRKICEKD